MSTPVLSCRGVSAGYGKLAVVRDFDLEAASGSVTAVLGPNGAGKSTLMLALAGLLPRLAGEVRVDGQVLPNGGPPRRIAPVSSWSPTTDPSSRPSRCATT
jgi:branched-chain amino acid transport system ATP-binding protein